MRPFFVISVPEGGYEPVCRTFQADDTVAFGPVGLDLLNGKGVKYTGRSEVRQHPPCVDHLTLLKGRAQERSPVA